MQMTVSSPSSPAAGGLDCMPQDLVRFLASIWLSKTIHSEKLLTRKAFCLTLLMAAIAQAWLNPIAKGPPPHHQVWSEHGENRPSRPCWHLRPLKVAATESARDN